MATYQTQWYYFPFEVESELVEIRARHYRIGKLELYIKLFSDNAYPRTPTVTINASDITAGATSFPTNYIFHESLIGAVYNPEAIRVVFTGDGTVSPDGQFITDIEFRFDTKQERKNG